MDHTHLNQLWIQGHTRSIAHHVTADALEWNRACMIGATLSGLTLTATWLSIRQVPLGLSMFAVALFLGAGIIPPPDKVIEQRKLSASYHRFADSCERVMLTPSRQTSTEVTAWLDQFDSLEKRWLDAGVPPPNRNTRTLARALLWERTYQLNKDPTNRNFIHYIGYPAAIQRLRFGYTILDLRARNHMYRPALERWLDQRWKKAAHANEE